MRKIKVKSHTRKGQCYNGPVDVKAHTREINSKKASSGSKPPKIDLTKPKSNEIDYSKVLTRENKRIIDDSIKSAIFDENDSFRIDTEGMISRYTDDMTPQEYANFKFSKARKVLLSYALDKWAEERKKSKKKATFSGSGNEYIGWIFNIEGKSPPYKTFSTIQEAKKYFEKNNYQVDWRGLDKNRITKVKQQ